MFALGVASRWGGGGGGEGGGWHSISLLFENSILLIKVQGYRGMEVSILEVLFFLLVYTAQHIMVFGAVCYHRNSTLLQKMCEIPLYYKKCACKKYR